MLIHGLLQIAGAPAGAAHPAALAAVCPLAFLVFLRSGDGVLSSPRISLLLLLRFFLAWVISVSFQGAILGILHQLYPHHMYLSVSVAALGGVAMLLIVSASWVFPLYDNSVERVQNSVGVFVIAMVALRFVYLGLPELMEQEAYYWNYAQHPALSYLDHPPMVAMLIWLGTKLFGISEFGVRIGAFLCWFVTAYFIYCLTIRIFDKQAALGAVLLLAVLPLYFGVGFLMTPDAPLHAAWAALLYFSYRVLIEESAGSWLGIGASLGLGLLSKYTIVLLGPPFLLFMLIDPRARKWFLKPGPYLAFVMVLVLFSPVLIWNMQHEWASFLFQSAKRISSTRVITTPGLIGHITLILTPAGVAGALLFFLYGSTIMSSANLTENAGSPPAVERTRLLLFLLAFLPCALFFVISFSREVKLNWTSPVWLAVLPFLGFTITSVYGRLFSISLKAVQELWRFTVPILVFALAVGLHYVTLGLPGVPHPPGPFLIGWEELASEVEGLADEMESESGMRPLVVGMDHYQITSGLAFYRTKNAIKIQSSNTSVGIEQSVGWHLFGHNSRMYRMWFDLEDWQPVDVIAVSSKRSRLEKESFGPEVMFKSEILPLPAFKDGQEVRRFYYRLISAASFK